MLRKEVTLFTAKVAGTGHILSFHQLHPNKTLVLIGLIIERSHFVSECLKLICDIVSIRPSLGVAKFVISKIKFFSTTIIRRMYRFAMLMTVQKIFA